jgi:hypothetical protein
MYSPQPTVAFEGWLCLPERSDCVNSQYADHLNRGSAAVTSQDVSVATIKGCKDLQL